MLVPSSANQNVWFYVSVVSFSEGIRTLGKPRYRWVDNIKMDFREIERDGMDWIDVAQDRDQ
jgi:hypothetical protein